MKYLLSEDEYNALIEAGNIARSEIKDTLQDLCTRVANSEPSFKNYDGTMVPWGCILSVGARDRYCDECPTQLKCPYEFKRWSK